MNNICEREFSLFWVQSSHAIPMWECWTTSQLLSSGQSYPHSSSWTFHIIVVKTVTWQGLLTQLFPELEPLPRLAWVFLFSQPYLFYIKIMREVQTMKLFWKHLIDGKGTHPDLSSVNAANIFFNSLIFQNS